VLGIEVKSGRVRKPEGLARFCQRYPEAVPVVLDLKKGEQLLSGATLDGLT
jgi:phosphoribosylformimino-5-aminoimidazole carboxamide ribonucleotide (ProFAR) isomerase